ncbi:NUDIX domain-containing protein [Nocardioides sp. NPDC057764]|uniref:NUDIX domain-containing protein n=1 Tax=Nocardioides sp. NPDC057764 TaxID=3346243 RepID=UPI00366B738D
MTNAIAYNTAGDHSPSTDPHEIDWLIHQRQAVVPFDITDGLPTNPTQPNLPAGRGALRHWGEAVCADAVIIGAGPDGGRRLLMIERGDGLGWALPGGKLDPGETPIDACVRELAEETSLQLDPAGFTMLEPQAVPDPRAGANSWMVTVPGLTLVGGDPLPAVQGLDDAADAAWIPADSWEELTGVVDVFSAHTDLIHNILDALETGQEATLSAF